MNSIEVVDFGDPRGRGVVALRSFKNGEAIFTESPLLCCQFSWNRLYGYLACDHCMRPLESAEDNAKRLTNNATLVLPHPDCGSLSSFIQITHCTNCGVPYCSQECLKSASALYHSAICPSQRNIADSLNHLDEVWRQMHYPPETSTIMLLIRIVGTCLSAHIYQSVPSQQIIAALKTFVSSTVVRTVTSDSTPREISHKLLRPEFVPFLQKLHESFLSVLERLTENCSIQMSSNLDCLTVLKQIGLDSLLDIENFKSALCLLGRNGQGIATSAFSLWARSAEQYVESLGDSQKSAQFDEFLGDIYSAMENHVGSFLDNEGVGLYQQQSLLNHSCAPNATVEFSGESNHLSVVACRDISPGEEITISYLDECQQSRSRHTRRKYLSTNYLFWCECEKCQREKLDGAVSETSESDADDDGDADLPLDTD